MGRRGTGGGRGNSIHPRDRCQGGRTRNLSDSDNRIVSTHVPVHKPHAALEEGGQSAKNRITHRCHTRLVGRQILIVTQVGLAL